MIRRFVRSNEFKTPFALKLLSKTLMEIVGEDKKEEVKANKVEKEAEAPATPKTCIKEPELDDSKNKLESGCEASDSESFLHEVDSNMSESTVLFESDACAKVNAVKELSSNEESNINKRDFFRSDSDTETSESSSKSSENRKRRGEKGNKRKNDKNETKGAEEGSTSDDENKKLERLLRMTEIHSNKSKTSASDSEEEKENVENDSKDVRKKNASKDREEELTLMDCMNATEGSDIELTPGFESKKDNEADIWRIFNDEMKNIFLQSSSENECMESETTNEVVKKKTQEKKQTVKCQKRRNDPLRFFRISDVSSGDDDSVNHASSVKDVETISDSEVIEEPKEVQAETEKTSLENLDKEPTPLCSDGSDSSSDIQQVYVKKVSPIKGRKNIKKLLKKESLHVETKQALKMETERKRRVSEKQKLYDKFFSNKEDTKLVLDFDPETGEELLVVDSILAHSLKPHQRKGVQFMWNSCFESLKKLEEDSGSGCILAHCMGLGKTFQVITLVHTVLTNDTGVRTVMVVCPLNTVKNWLKEFQKWLTKCVNRLCPYSIISCRKEERLSRILAWSRKGGVLVISYEMFRTLTQKKLNKEAFYLEFGPSLLDPGPDLVVCDEGHVLKNETTALSKCLSEIKSLRRIILTGTPLQNNLIEYYCMVQFVKPNILGTRKEFMNRFVNPIQNGQFEDSTEMDVKIMKRRSHVLHTMLDGFIQRFNYKVLTPFLPEKQEYVISISLTQTQINMYRYFVNMCAVNARGLFKDFHWLQRVWTHPLVMLNYQKKQKDDEPVGSEWKKFVDEKDYGDLRSSGKLILLFHILKKCKETGDKVLVFSKSLENLNLIENFLKKANDDHENKRNDGFADSWILGLDYFRMDGSTSVNNRDRYSRKFNNPTEKRSRLFLISTRAGGLGINLVGANRVVVFDASWNPSHDIQCIFRVYRFGQTKTCYVYRFLASATMEEKIYRRQVTKLSLAYRILDEHQIERHYTAVNLHELYTFEPVPRKDWGTPKLPKDSLFAEMLMLNRDIIVGYHEHDSLLENKQDEELTEEERRVAWEEYEKEKQAINRDVDDSILNKRLGNDLLRVTAKKGYYPVPGEGLQNLVISNSSNQLCKIVDVRTLTASTGTQIGPSRIDPGANPRLPNVWNFDNRNYDIYARRMEQQTYPWNLKDSMFNGNASTTNRN